MERTATSAADVAENKPDPHATPKGHRGAADKQRTRAAAARRSRISKVEQLERRKVLIGLMVNRIDPLEVERQMHDRFGMKPRQVKRLQRELERDLQEEGKELLPLLKAKAVNRLHAHIIKASRDASWNAVSSLERVLADIQGTREPVQVNVRVDARVQEAVVHLLSSVPPEQLDALAAQGAALLTHGGQAPPAPPDAARGRLGAAPGLPALPAHALLE